MKTTAETFEALVAHLRETALLASVDALLGWDERCLLPPAAGAYRAEQMSLLAGLIHRRATDPQIGDWLSRLAGSDLAQDPHSPAGTLLRRTRKLYDRKTRLPQRLVEELARATVRGQQLWQEARPKNDYAGFQPALAEILRLKREEAQALHDGGPLYDALLEDYEPGESTVRVTQVLGELRAALVPLVQRLAAAQRPAPAVLARSYPLAEQERFGRLAAERIGYDFRRGRLDVTAHPFCTSLGPDDVRICTRYHEHALQSAFYSTLHEAGHGLYEQGLDGTWFGLPPGTAASMGIHESQSRLWENLVGRSHGFWQFFFPQARQLFPAALGDVALDDFYAAVNHVAPSLIRVEADEATYNLHILIRFELEQVLLAGELSVADLPAAWNEKYRHYLGLNPPDHNQGVLQDVHWSAGLFGYFPTYSLGNLYAAQFAEAAEQALGPLAPQFAQGEFRPLLDWLRTHIHRHGQCYTPAELVERVTGRPLSHQPLIDYLTDKLTPLHPA